MYHTLSTTSRLRRRALMLFAALATTTSSAMASVTIYGTNGVAGGTLGQNTLVKFNSDNPGGWETVGAFNVFGATFVGLEFAGSPDTLYGYASDTITTPGLYSIDIETGQASVIGTYQNQYLDSIAWNPIDNTMYGIRQHNLYTIDLNTGQASHYATMSGLPTVVNTVGLAIDSNGTFHVHDLHNEKIYAGRPNNMQTLIDLPINTNFAQDIAIDWSRDNMGFHAANGSDPAIYGHFYEFGTGGDPFYNYIGQFHEDDAPFPPDISVVALAVVPVPAPGAVALLGLAGLFGRTRRRN